MEEIYVIILEKRGRGPEFFKVKKEEEFKLPEITKWAIKKNYERITIKKCKVKFDHFIEE